MRRLNLIPLLLFLMCAIPMVAQQLSPAEGAYRTWLNGSGSTPHFYLSGKMLRVDGGVASVQVGVGGQMTMYRLKAQGVVRQELPNGEVTFAPVGELVDVVRDHNRTKDVVGSFDQSIIPLPLDARANAVALTLTPLPDFKGMQKEFQIVAPITVEGPYQFSQGGIQYDSIGCANNCKLTTGACGYPCNSSFAICCPGDAVLDCANCKVYCQSGKPCPMIIYPKTSESVEVK